MEKCCKLPLRDLSYRTDINGEVSLTTFMGPVLQDRHQWTSVVNYLYGTCPTRQTLMEKCCEHHLCPTGHTLIEKCQELPFWDPSYRTDTSGEVL